MAVTETAPVAVPKVLLTVEEAAEAMSLSRSLVYLLLGSGDIASIKVGRIRRIPFSALQDFVSRRLADVQKAG
jgi:excisionase family DNA binding protein